MKKIKFKKKISDLHKKIINKNSNDFFIHIHNRFHKKRQEILNSRKIHDEKIKNGILPDFLKKTKLIREGGWQVAPLPKELKDRRVEITGPVDRKMVINGLNSGAKVYMADFEDSQSPTWDGMIDGQVNLHDAVRRTIDFTNEKGKKYQLNKETALLMVRPRGWHLEEKHVLVDEEIASASLFDFSYYFFNNVDEWVKQGKKICFYIPKLEHYEEANLWKEVFEEAEDYFKLPKGIIKVTVLIETITAVFEMEEILYELRDYCVGLNCGRWDYIFSFIKKFSHSKDFLLPDRAKVDMGTHFLRSYSKLLIDTCHKRGALAMGGMAAQIPIKNDDIKNNLALDKVRKDKEREAETGHDGTWVAHPGLIKIAGNIFDQIIPPREKANQLDKRLSEAQEITNKDLLKIPPGDITLNGFLDNITVSIHYLAAWISGNGCVPINHLMEDLATAEISRAQLWQWIHHPGTKLKEGQEITVDFFIKHYDRTLNYILNQEERLIVDRRFYEQANVLLKKIILQETFSEFLSLEGYDYLSLTN